MVSELCIGEKLGYGQNIFFKKNKFVTLKEGERYY